MASCGVAAERERPLGSCVGFAIGGIEGRKQKQTSRKTSGISGGSNGHIDASSRGGEGRQIGSHKNRGDILDGYCGRRDLYAHVL